MKLRRGDEAPRPDPWRVVLHNSDAARGWPEFLRHARTGLDRAWCDITADPRSMANPSRQHRLKGGLSSVKIGTADLEQWQYEITAGGRLWYAINDEERTIYITKASIGHPGVTDKSGGRRKR